MTSISGITAATQGIQRGLQDASRSAEKIAQAAIAESSLDDIIQGNVELLQSTNQVQASVKALQILNATLGAVIDIKA